MVYNAENGASLQKLPDKSQTSGNNCGCNCWKLKKKKVKHQNFSQTTGVN